ncbi:hypothetical protein ILUMI_16112, partial [Ignelater luminosus]
RKKSTCFSDWKHAYERLHVHKTSLGHKNGVLKIKKRRQAEARIDSKLLEQLEDERKYCAISSHKRVIKRKKRDDEYREGEVLSLERDHFRINIFFPICDQLLDKLRMRKTSYDAVTSNFAFLCKLDTMSEADKTPKVIPD